MSEGVIWVLAALATVRLTWSLIEDDGPADLFFLIRKRLGAYDYIEIEGEDGEGELAVGINGQPEPKTKLGEFVNCPLCMSLVIALPMAIIAGARGVDGLILGWLGLAGAAQVVIRWRPWRRW